MIHSSPGIQTTKRIASRCINLHVVACAAVLLTSILLISAVSADTPPLNNPPRQFYFGTEFRPDSPEPVRQLFFETGMNWVRLTGGGYGWSVDAHKKVADDFEARGLKVCLQLGSHYPPGGYLDLKDAYMVDQDGKPGVADKTLWAVTYSGQAWPQYSYTNPVFRDRLTKDFTDYVTRFNDNHNIAGVILHNEPGYFWLSDRVFDYNPTSIAAFRKWLEQKHGTIATLNGRWGTTYATFTDVVPPGKPPESNLAAWMDWRRFSVDVVAEFMKWEADFFHTLRPDVPRTTNLDGPLNNWYGYRGANMQAYSAAMDRVGIDIYPGPYTTRDFVPYSTDMVQGVAQGRDTNVLESESYSTEQWKSFDEEQRARFLRSEMWTMIGHGMNGILLWGFDTFSGNDGTFNPRILACRDIAHQTQMIGVQDFRRQKSRVALCVDPDTYIHDCGIEKSQNQYTTDLDHEMGGFHAALADAGIQTDVILLSQLPLGVLKNYDVLVLPSAMMMDEETAALLKNFVSGGGTLIAAEPFSTLDRWAHPLATVPAFGLDEVFGCTVSHAGSTGVQGGISTKEGNVDGRTSNASVTVHGAEVLGTFPDGSPAITRNAFGQGHAIFFARQVGLPYLEYKSPEALSALLADLLQQASILPVAQETEGGGTLDVSSLTDPHGNTLVISSIPTSEGKSLPAIQNARISYRCDDPTSFRMAFTWPATSTADGLVRSGPVPLDLTTATNNQSLSFHLATIDQVVPVLLAKDAGPLLAVETPQAAANGQETAVTVTCYNPSSQTVLGEIGIRAGAALALTADKISVEIPPYDQKTVTVKVKVVATTPQPRAPLTVFLTRSGQSPEITGIPVDIEVK